MNGNNIKLNRAIFILSIIGTVVAVYVLQSFLRKTSIVCVNGGCEMVRKSPLSYIFGIPVPAFGLVGYSVMTVISFLRTIKDSIIYLRAILGIALFGICFTGWFTYTEIFLIKGICTWCALSAVNMWIIFFLAVGNYQIITKGNK
jgi:uncharacterized membrane protein